MCGECLRCRFTHMPDAYCIKHLLKRCLERFSDALEESFRRTVFPSVKCKQMLFFKFIEVCNAPDITFIVKLVDRSVAGYYVHCLAAEEVHQLALYLCRTSRLIRTECLSFLLISYQSDSAIRTSQREVGKCRISRPHAQLHTCDLRNDLSAFLYIDIIAYMDVKQLHLVCIMKRSTLYYCAAELHRIEVCHRSDCSCSSDLIVD